MPPSDRLVPESRGMSATRRRRLVRTVLVATAITAAAAAAALGRLPAAGPLVSEAQASSREPAGASAAAGSSGPTSSSPSSSGPLLGTPAVAALDLPMRGAAAAAAARASRSADVGAVVPPRVADARSVQAWLLGDQGLLWPVAGGRTAQLTGWREHPVYGYRSCHTGDDIQGTWGTPVLAAQSGVVVWVRRKGAYGIHTLVQHLDGMSTMYAHQQKVLVKAGQHVARGEVIGQVGSTGWVTGPHLHFEVHLNGVPFEPYSWFRPVGAHARVACLPAGATSSPGI